MHVYYKAKIKNKNAWLQACFLRDVRVIWCNSLGDSHFQTYVMNNVEIVIDYYLHITSHVSHAVTSCKHFTSYSLLNLVHEIVCEFGLAIQIICSMILMQNMFIDWNLGAKCVIILFLKVLGWKTMFLKNF